MLVRDAFFQTLFRQKQEQTESSRHPSELPFGTRVFIYCCSIVPTPTCEWFAATPSGCDTAAMSPNSLSTNDWSIIYEFPSQISIQQSIVDSKN